MAYSTWTGGTRKLTDPTAWTSNPPATGDLGIIPAGHAVGVSLSLDGYDLSIGNITSAPAASLDLLNSTLGPNFLLYSGTPVIPPGQYYLPGEPYPGDIPGYGPNVTYSFIGKTNSAATIYLGQALGDTDSYYFGGAVGTIYVSDVSSRSTPSVAIQPGLLTNTASIFVGGGSNILLKAVAGSGGGTSSYAQFSNEGGVYVLGSLTIDAPVVGTGGFGLYSSHYVSYGPPGGSVDFKQYVAATQTVSLGWATLTVDNPLAFYATITGFDIDFGSNAFNAYNTIFVAGTVTRGNFDGSELTLYNGNTLVGHLKFAPGLMAGNFAIYTSGGRTGILFNASGHGGPIPVTSGAGAVIIDPGSPVLTPPVLPSISATDITITDGMRTISQATFDSYAVRLEGTTSAAYPSVGMSFGSVGAYAEVLVGDGSTTAHYGRINAVGYNNNFGTIAAEGSGTNASRLILSIQNLSAPESSAITVQPGVFNNTGLIDAMKGSTINIAGDAGSKLINAGTISAEGQVFIGTALTDTGKVVVNSGGYAGFDFGVSTGQSIYQNAASGFIGINDIADFGATIYETAQGGRILFGTTQEQPDSFSYNNGKLTLLDAGVQIGALHFHRAAGTAIDASSFLLTQSSGGAGGYLDVTPHTA